MSNIQKYIQEFLSGKRESTKVTYNKEIKEFDYFIKEYKKTGKLKSTVNMVDRVEDAAKAYKEYLNKKKSDGTYTNNTIIKKLRILLSFYNYLVKKRIIKDNPFFKIKVPKQGTIGDVSDALTDRELNKLLNYVSNYPRDKFLIYLIITSRMTPIQITNLKWGSFIIDGFGLYGAKVISRGGKERFVAIHKFVIEVIMHEYRRSIGKPANIQPEEEDEYVFSPDGKNPISNLRKLTYSICKKAGIKKCSPMDLAHTGVYVMKRFKATDNQIKSQAGFHHVSVLRKYDHPLHELHEQACHIIDINELIKNK